MRTRAGEIPQMHAWHVEGERIALLPSINKAMRKAVAEWPWAALLETDPRRPVVVMPESYWGEFRQTATRIYPRWEIAGFNGDNPVGRPPWLQDVLEQLNAPLRDEARIYQLWESEPWR